ncbi:type II toxin-antitoxin system RelE/ParE family toxin [Pseudacidovorax intermedius]|uniref:Putative addiction module killer protein n=2 Tax=Pseudacidovorax TaxID=433923 RepID=A0A370FP83_9BURK|nr:type II toxin-antitoxin system RelE/ParE family toxin [Pseudacidovorax intermedius]RDI28684.1 putative addiction module killer protein [Pseudacidovorax intermedius]
MLDVQLTTTFQRWLGGLTDLRARIAIARRLERLAAGNAGDSKSVGEGVTEMRVDVGPGYRVYYTRRGQQIVIVLAGGDKSSQQRDIQRAQTMAKEY